MTRTFSGSALRAARCSAGLSLERVAIAVGRSASIVQSYELGRATPRANLLPLLADAVGVKLDELFGQGDADVAVIDAVA